MTVIIKTPKGQIKAYMKGADSIILDRLNLSECPGMSSVQLKLDECAKIGLRTLLIASKDISDSEYEKFKTKYDEAKNDINNRETRIPYEQDEFEIGFKL